MERKNRRMSDGKKNIISALIEEYDIQSADDLQDALKDLLGGTIQEMLESEMTEHLGYTLLEQDIFKESNFILKIFYNIN